MEAHTKRPGAKAGPSEPFSGGNGSDDTKAPTLAQLLQVARLRRDHGIPADRAALIAPLCYGEGAA